MYATKGYILSMLSASSFFAEVEHALCSSHSNNRYKWLGESVCVCVYVCVSQRDGVCMTHREEHVHAYRLGCGGVGLSTPEANKFNILI